MRPINLVTEIFYEAVQLPLLFPQNISNVNLIKIYSFLNLEKLLRYFTLLLTILSLVFYQTAPTLTIYTPKITAKTTALHKWIGTGPLFFYDDIIALLDAIENNEIEECCSKDEEEIVQFLILLARQGVLPGEEEILEQDIQELLSHKDCFHACLPLTDGIAFSTQMETVLCTGWIKKQSTSAKKFIKKHKTAFIIGTVVIAAAAVILVAASPAIAASAAGASTAAASKETNKPSIKDEESSLPSTNIETAADAIFEEHIASFKEFMLEDNLRACSESF